MQQVGAVVVAAGRSSRMGGVDKVFAPLCGWPLFCHALSALEACSSVGEIVLVTAAERVEDARTATAALDFSKLRAICSGGERRQDSVLAGLEQFGHLDLVVVHDAARPLVTVDMVERGIAACAETGAAIAAVPVVDTLKQADGDGNVVRTVDRSSLWAVQTPQVFDYDMLLTAHRRWPAAVTDDAMLIESVGGRVKIFLGSPRNLKVTAPDDLVLAEALLAAGS
jgi:2-C-methyl-D-erythritol 4-phosphate cytidylyltransferase